MTSRGIGHARTPDAAEAADDQVADARPGHPRLAATLLMVGVVALVVALSLLEALGR
jgi:hypothetical protein